MSDYKVTDTQLTSIANAIRAKTGKSAQIEFPTEFVSEIGSISGGTGTLGVFRHLGKQFFLSESENDIINTGSADNFNTDRYFTRNSSEPIIVLTGLYGSKSDGYAGHCILSFSQTPPTNKAHDYNSYGVPVYNGTNQTPNGTVFYVYTITGAYPADGTRIFLRSDDGNTIKNGTLLRTKYAKVIYQISDGDYDAGQFRPDSDSGVLEELYSLIDALYEEIGS